MNHSILPDANAQLTEAAAAQPDGPNVAPSAHEKEAALGQGVPPELSPADDKTGQAGGDGRARDPSVGRAEG
ncbi:MAG: hypothetical protein JWQ88_3704 [Rhodoferax sp.]|nr:hypothetical protein [Rhodoferax sp.]